MNGLALVYTLFGTAEEARSVARQLVSEKLAGCANILSPCTSIYDWQGEMQEGGEVPVLLKTRPEKRAALIGRLTELHSYEVPAILSWEAGVNEVYADWIGRGAG